MRDKPTQELATTNSKFCTCLKKLNKSDLKFYCFNLKKFLKCFKFTSKLQEIE